MSKALALFSFGIVIVGTGLAHGLLTDRWGSSHVLSEAVQRLEAVPLSFGSWHGEAQELDADQAKLANIDGSLVRTYTDRRSGARITILLVCGRSGPIAVHSPDICYVGAGYAMHKQPTRQVISTEPPAEFWVGQFRKQDAAVPRQLDIFWAWKATGRWEAPDQPRLHYAFGRLLYKLYVIHEGPLTELPDRNGVCGDFLRDFLPVLDRALTAGSPQPVSVVAAR